MLEGGGGGSSSDTSSVRKYRRPGAGAKKTKKANLELDLKKRKATQMDTIIALQQKRQANFAMYVANQSCSEAFKMAALGYQTFKDNPEEAQKYPKDIMDNIITNNSAGDNEMPALQVLRMRMSTRHSLINPSSETNILSIGSRLVTYGPGMQLYSHTIMIGATGSRF